MPRVQPIQTNFTAGEISPRLHGRVDIAKYNDGLHTCENALPLIHGGVRGHFGSIYVAPTKDHTRRSRLIPFVFSTTQAYVIEVGHLYMRFFTNDAQILSAPLTPFEVATLYTEAQLAEVDYAMGEDTMFLFHKDVAVYRLRRFADAAWDMSVAPFDPAPFAETGDAPAFTATLSAVSGAGVTITLSGAYFVAADVGRTITYLGGSITITAVALATSATGTVTSTFSTTNLPSGLWTINGSPFTALTPGAKDPEGTSTTLTAAANAFRPGDVGAFVKINGGLMLITSYVTALQVNATIIQVLTGTVAAPAEAWSLNKAAWSSVLGYPRCGTFYSQRLCVGGTNQFPRTAWGSAIAAPLDFTLTTFDDDAFTFKLVSDQSNPIVHLVSGKILTALTTGNEFTVAGGVEKPITPTNIQSDDESVYGSSTVKPIRVGKEILFVQRANTRLRALQYASDTGRYESQDLAVLAEHITKPAITDLSYAQEPEPVVWVPRSDGQMATLSYSREQNVQGWARRTTDGVFESVATIPRSTGDQTWAVVQRTIGGVTKRYVERFDADMHGMDSAVTGTSGPGANVWGGLSHLIGKTVACVADGADMGNFVVSASGDITLPRNAFSVRIGLLFSATVKLLTPEIQTGTGTAQGQQMSTTDIIVSVLDTQHLRVNGKEIPFRALGGQLLDQPPPAFTGVKSIFNLGWMKGASEIVFTTTRPFPFHIRSVVRQFTVNTGGQE